MESTLLADTVRPTAEAELLATGSTAMAPANLDMPTAEEFYDISPLEDAQAGDEKDREESPASFDATSHQMPELPTPRKACHLIRWINCRQRRIREVRREEDLENVNFFILVGIG